MQKIIFEELNKRKEEQSKPRKGYIQRDDLEKLQRIKDFVYREYNLDKLMKAVKQTNIKNCMDFHDSNVEDRVENV
jgi:hypothetical protein